MAEGAEYPKALYRDGGTEMLWGEAIETKIARDEDAELEALANGWRLHPLQRDEQAAPRRGRPPKIRIDTDA